jgi:hypothetical protein
VDDAEALVEGVALLDGDRLGEAAGGDGEAVEEADAAEQDEAVAVPVLDEADLGLPRQIRSLCAVGGVQAQRDRLVAGRQRPTADRGRGSAHSDIKRLVRMRDAAVNHDVIATLGLAEDYVRVVVRDHDLARA